MAQPRARKALAELLDQLVHPSPGKAQLEAALAPDCLPIRLALQADDETAGLVQAEVQRLGADASLHEDQVLTLATRRAPIYSTTRYHYFLPQLRTGAWVVLGMMILIGQVPLVMLILLINAFQQRVAAEEYERLVLAPNATPPNSVWTVVLVSLFALPVFLLPLIIFATVFRPGLLFMPLLVGGAIAALLARRRAQRKHQAFALDKAAVATYLSGFDTATLTSVRQTLRDLGPTPRLAGILSQAVVSAYESIASIRRAGKLSGDLLAPVAGKLERMLRHLCNALGRSQRLETYLQDHNLEALDTQANELERRMDATTDLGARDLLRQALQSKEQEVQQFQQIMADRDRLEAQLAALQASFSQLHSHILKITLLDVQYGTDESGDLERKLKDLAIEVNSVDAGISELYSG